MTGNVIAIATFLIVAAFVLAPGLRASPLWRATVTPLASIIGSGFLVSLPLLTEAVGSRAVFAMAALCGSAYLLGGAIRFNILYGEPMFDRPDRFHFAATIERVSHLALAFAYFISVTYYLTLLSSFLLKGVGIVDPLDARAITTAFLAAIGVYGMWKGLHGLESIEEYAVGLKLAVIAAVLAALVWLNIERALAGTWQLPPDPPFTWNSARVVLGTLIVVQGFETARFLKGEYAPELRNAAMRLAQILASLIYLAFFALAAIVASGQSVDGDVAAVTTMMAVAAALLPLMLVFGAVFAQASAAIADAIGASGLLAEFGGHQLCHSRAYPIVAACGIVLVWLVDVFEVIALASRAFALFYFIQCLGAVETARSTPHLKRRSLRMAWYFLLALLAGSVVVFGIPVEGGG